MVSSRSASENEIILDHISSRILTENLSLGKMIGNVTAANPRRIVDAISIGKSKNRIYGSFNKSMSGGMLFLC